MRAPGKFRKPARRLRPFRRIRRSVSRWQRRIAIGLGLAPPLADRGYMICATSRTGSTYLCQLLSSTGVLGNPREYFNTAGQRRRFDPAYPTNRRAQLDIIRTRGATGNGIYGVKVIGPQLLSLAGSIDPFRDLPNLALVRIRRHDLLGQAISLARARQTGQFIASDLPRGAAAYNAGAIRHGLRSIEQQDAIWDAAIGPLGVQPLSIAYEDILADPQVVVDRIAELMGLAPPVPIDRAIITQTMQRDQQNAEWRARFVADTGDEFRHLASR
jgi:trehalose 2-sulfotransferase